MRGRFSVQPSQDFASRFPFSVSSLLPPAFCLPPPTSRLLPPTSYPRGQTPWLQLDGITDELGSPCNYSRSHVQHSGGEPESLSRLGISAILFVLSFLAKAILRRIVVRLRQPTRQGVGE